MPARAPTRTGASRRPLRRRTIAVEEEPTRLGLSAADRADDWAEPEFDNGRLEEADVDMLLNGRAATHGAEGEDNWLLETEDVNWNER